MRSNPPLPSQPSPENGAQPSRQIGARKCSLVSLKLFGMKLTDVTNSKYIIFHLTKQLFLSKINPLATSKFSLHWK